jgi:hypothetical protein
LGFFLKKYWIQLLGRIVVRLKLEKIEHRPGRKNHLSFVLRTKEGVLRKYPIFGGIHAFKLAGFI